MNCRLDYSAQWAVRCMCEAQMYDENSFVTLTYNDDYLPSDGSVRRKELQNFMKRLRNRMGKDIRFFGCGEYGEKYTRPHYHVCLFGCDFHDKEIFRGSKAKGNKDLLYVSKDLGKVWKKGFHTIGRVNFKTAGYVARYVTKKHFGKWKDFMYDGLEPEFALMSRGQKKGGKGGIGKSWLKKYWSDCYPKDFIMIDGKRFRVPKYFDDVMMKINPEMIKWVKAKRELEGFKAVPETNLRQMQKEKYRQLLAKRLEREIENGNN